MTVRPFTILLVALGHGRGAFSMHNAAARSDAVALPDPKGDATAAAKGDQVAVFAGGCFWGVQAVFEHVKGVK